MLQYLVILLDDTSVAYCHAENPLIKPNLMPIEMLKKAIFWAMKENLMVQYVYPNYELPDEYNEVIERIDHVKIGRDIVVYSDVPSKVVSDNIVLRLKLEVLLAKQLDISLLLSKVSRLNISIVDIENFQDNKIEAYRNALSTWSTVLVEQIKAGKQTQFNLLTDRIHLKEMHNCDAGVGNITLAPNGKFYLCPAFYYDEQMGVSNRMNHVTKESTRSVGDLENGLDILNQQLLKLDHAPLCRICDAYHCHRCVWLNQKLTWDINTPSRQQCVLSHIERNASRDLQQRLKAEGFEIKEEIKEITYLDPFEVREQW